VLKGWGWTSSLSVTDDGEYYGLLRSRKKIKGALQRKRERWAFPNLWRGIIV
jgi:hypothetical protein